MTPGHKNVWAREHISCVLGRMNHRTSVLIPCYPLEQNTRLKKRLDNASIFTSGKKAVSLVFVDVLRDTFKIIK